MKQQSRTVPRRRQSVSPTPRHLPLVDILIDTQAEFQELVVASGLKVLEAMLDEDRAAVCGPRYAHQPARQASRTGHTPSQVVLGGRKVAIRRPRARRAGEEVPLPTARAFANADPLNRRVVDQMLIGVATRQYARSLEPLGADVTTRGTSKRAVSRRVVAQTQAQLDAWRATPLDALDLVGLLIDGVHVGGHCIVVALAVRGESPTSHRESSGSTLRRTPARRDEGVYRQHSTEEQHSQGGCSASRMQRDFQRGLLAGKSHAWLSSHRRRHRAHRRAPGVFSPQRGSGVGVGADPPRQTRGTVKLTSPGHTRAG